MPRSAFVSKLTCPRPVGVLARERLFAALDHRRPSSLIWLSGPAGSGKTTLLSSYLAARKPASCWYQLDSADSEVATFFYYLRLAVNAQATLPLYTAEYHSDLSTFARAFFAAFYRQFEQPFVLAFDNYQDVTDSSALHTLVLEAIAELPPEGCIIIASRSDPPASMVRLRANRGLDVLGGQELALTRKESDALVALWGTELSEQALAELYAKTQGWAAGLVLMLDQAATTGNVGEVPDAIGPQLVFDYLAGEVFDELDRATQMLLLNTALLPEFTASMAGKLSGHVDAGDMLSKLYRSYHFVVQKRRAGAHVFQYHPLFREFLQVRASTSLSTKACALLYQRSAQILEEADDLDTAVGLLTHIGAWAKLAALLHRHGEKLLEQGRAETLQRWLELMPEHTHQGDAGLIGLSAACLLRTAPRESRLLSERAYQIACNSSAPDRKHMLLGCCGAMDAILQELDDLSLLDLWIERIEAMLAESEGIDWPEIRVRVALSMMMALVFRQPHHSDIARWAERVYDEVNYIPDANFRVLAQLLLALNLNYTGQFARARELLVGMREECTAPYATPHASMTLKLVESLYAMFTVDTARCLDAVYDGMEIGRSTGTHVWSYHLLSNGVAGALGAGDLDTAADLLEQLSRFSQSARRLDLCIYHYYKGWYAMLRSDSLNAAQELKSALRFAVETGCPFYEVQCRIAVVQVYVESADFARASTQLDTARRASSGIKNRLLQFMCELAHAQYAYARGQMADGLRALNNAMTIGRENAFTHTLWWLPSVMARLCRRALEAGIEVDYVTSIVRGRDLFPEPAPLQVEYWPWQFRIRSLGHFSVERDGENLDRFAKSAQKPAALLRAIVGLGARDVKECTLGSVLWPRIDATCAQRSLTTNLHRLRKMLGEDRAVIVAHGRVSLNERYCWLDTWAFEEYALEAEQLMKSEASSDLLDAALLRNEQLLNVYQGPLLGGEPGDEWCATYRQRLRNKFLRHTGQLLRLLEEAQEWERAIDGYWRVLEVDRLAEGLYRRLMVCYQALGRPADVLEVYDNCRRAFQTELNSEPSHETVAIYRSLIGV